MPVVVTPTPPAPPLAPTEIPGVPLHPARRVLQIIGGNGDALTLTDRPNGFHVRGGAKGLDVPPVEVQTSDSAADGTRVRAVRWLPREVEWTQVIHASTEAVKRQRVARLVEILNTKRYGPAQLVVGSPDGSARAVAAHYAGGAEGENGHGIGTPLYQVWPLKLLCPDPLFSSLEPVVIDPWRLAAAPKPFLSSTSPFFPIRFASSQIIGQLEILNPGDEDAFALWNILGPGGPITIGNAAGRAFVFDTVLESGDVRTVDTGAKLVLDGDGENAWPDLGPAPKLWTIPPGKSVASVELLDATMASRIALQFFPRWKTGS